MLEPKREKKAQYKVRWPGSGYARSLNRGGDSVNRDGRPSGESSRYESAKEKKIRQQLDQYVL